MPNDCLTSVIEKLKNRKEITKGLLGGAFYDLDLGVAPGIAEN